MVQLAHPILLGGEDRKKWLKERKNHVTGTDIYTIFGYGWDGRTVADIAADKRNPEVNDEDVSKNERLRAGLELEPIIASRYTEFTGIPIKLTRTLHVDTVDPLRAASLDFLDDTGGIVETKAIFSYPDENWGPINSDHVPTKYLLQTTWQGGIKRLEKVDLAALFVGITFRNYRVKVHAGLFETLSQGAHEFMDAVKSGKEITAEWRPSMMKKVQEIALAEISKHRIELSAEADHLIDEYTKNSDIISNLESRQQQIKTQLQGMLGTFSKGVSPGGGSVIQYSVKGYWLAPQWRGPTIQARIYPPKLRSI